MREGFKEKRVSIDIQSGDLYQSAQVIYIKEGSKETVSLEFTVQDNLYQSANHSKR